MIQINITSGTPEEEAREVRELLLDPRNTIFERLDLMESEINAIKTNFLSKESTDINNKDLNECIGKVIFAYGNGCTNKPTTSNGYLINIPHDSKPDLYNKQIWFSRSSNEIWVRNLENGVWGAWQPVRYDSGWIDLPLASGISAYSSSQTPQYRKVGNTVYLRGAVKGIKQDKTIIGTLPTGYRPTKVVSFAQNMSMSGGAANFARWQVQTDGDIEMQYTNHSLIEYEGTEWFPIDANFLND